MREECLRMITENDKTNKVVHRQPFPKSKYFDYEAKAKSKESKALNSAFCHFPLSFSLYGGRSLVSKIGGPIYLRILVNLEKKEFFLSLFFAPKRKRKKKKIRDKSVLILCHLVFSRLPI